MNKKKEYMFYFLLKDDEKIGEENRLISFFCGEKNLNKNKDFFKTYLFLFFFSF